MKIGMEGTITFNNHNKLKVKIADIHTYPSTGFPSDYTCTYLEDNSVKRPLLHPSVYDGFILPEGLMKQLFTETK